MKPHHLLISLLCCMSFSCTAVSLPWNITDNRIPYIAMVKGNSERNFLVINPDFCSEIPESCRFFSESMNSHRQLNHLILLPEKYSMLDIAKADCFAVNFTSADEIQAAYALMQNDEAVKKYRLRGDLELRAEHLKQCSIKKNKWN